MDVVNRIMQYLKGCPGKRILFSNHGNLNIERYAYVDWAGCLDDRRTTASYCTFVGENLVSWRSNKQRVVARSMASGLCEVLWLRLLLTGIRLFQGGPIRLYRDNQVAINIINNPVQHGREKHIEID
jgi:hypothetical protein